MHTEYREEAADQAERKALIFLVHASNCDHNVRRSGERTDNASRRHEHQVPGQVIAFLSFRRLTIAGCHRRAIASTVFESLFLENQSKSKWPDANY